jgi:hypothetical protein
VRATKLTIAGDPVCQTCDQPFDDTTNEVHDHCAECATKCDCGAVVYKRDPFFATPCGTMCAECMGDHGGECAVCRAEFGG